MKNSPLDLARTLFRKADHDIQAVSLLIDSGPTDVICFHLQQAVEKYLKAYLQAGDFEFPRTHDLDALLDICQEATTAFEPLRERLETFIPYSVLIRYEIDYEPSRNEAKDGLILAHEVRALLLALVLSIDNHDGHRP